MIDPKYQWCQHVEITNHCNRSCSNCTRLVGHGEKFHMTLEQVEEALDALRDFPLESPPSEAAPFKLVGIMGGEPLMHPEFAEICCAMADHIPRQHRGLWTGLKWQETRHAKIIADTFDVKFIHNNLHEQPSRHSPILVSIHDAWANGHEEAIDNCWLQRTWSGGITPKGYFFCEVAGAMDWVFGGPGGVPVDGCWRRPLKDFRGQRELWCNRCGIPMNLKGRVDIEGVDDISTGNLLALPNSPRVRAGRYVLYDAAEHVTDDTPWDYRK